MRHTPTPWRIGLRKGSVIADSAEGITILGGTGKEAIEHYGGNLIAESLSEANAEFIVEACNDYQRCPRLWSLGFVLSLVGFIFSLLALILLYTR